MKKILAIQGLIVCKVVNQLQINHFLKKYLETENITKKTFFLSQPKWPPDIT